MNLLAAAGLAVLLAMLQQWGRLASDTLLGIFSHSALSLGLVTIAFMPGLRLDLMGYLFGDILSDLGPYRPGKGNYTIIYQSDFGVVGLPVETSVKIVDESDGSYSDAPPEEESAVVSQFFTYQDFGYPVLDIDKMLTLLSI